jgi:hypothetical protein
MGEENTDAPDSLTSGETDNTMLYVIWGMVIVFVVLSMIGIYY